ncbi:MULTISPECIES: TetR family transcriptional regulator [Rhodococcus]|uniref:TetR family transcriptional regulator n=1 Tax=Rhodococcus jostii TaxID=132919 RepID=A0ABU4CTF8_RHOJO|nr:MULTISPECIES: TetR family transcriptional regulator [Rhodococcus]MDI9976855.1 TetR family transcriptional regulator [Rhodococcus sp. IEGM 1307]MDV6286861.1 TetR family transcriptional regulator [Rhodococcus jostii]
MAWDTERTKRLLIEAGVAEFSSFGLAGARVDRIAEKAGVNKERIYQYFGKKEAFFSAVLEHELATTLAAVELSGHGVVAIADYAGRRFDYQREHPTFTRLLFWEGLELEAPVAEASRQQHAQAIVASAREAVPELSESDAQELLITVITLVDGWVALQTADRLFSTPLPCGRDRDSRRRDFIVMTVEAATRAALTRTQSARAQLTAGSPRMGDAGSALRSTREDGAGKV